MIKKRASKKLLAGLGASIAFSTTAFISGLGVKAIINNVNNDVQELRFNRINEATFNQLPNLSTPTRDMFLDTTRLGNVHAGTVRKGQTLTPWGWLGLYTENNKVSDNKPLHQKLALTGWNGEILWVNDDFQGESFADNKADIFDIKYDWNTDLIILARSGNPNGLFKPLDYTSVGENSLIIDVLDAQTGRKLQRIENNVNNNDLHNFAWSSFFAIRDNFFDVNNDLNRIEDLYSFDTASQQSGHVLTFYMPNFMQLYQKSTTTKIKQGTLPNFAKVLEHFSTLTRGWIFDRTASTATFKTRNVDPRKSSEITNQAWNFTDPVSNQTVSLNTNDFYLLANPFWTATSENEQFILHFIVANEAGDVYHKLIGFNLTNPSEQNNQPLPNFDKTEKIGTATGTTTGGLNFKLKANEWGNNANTWNPNFINANLRINKNMFDNNIVTFAFPVAASQNTNGEKNFPIFDVAQIKINAQGLIDRTTNNNQLSSRIFDLGNQILNNNNINNWPGIGHSSLTHNYNHLVSVSPFDNTFIYNAMPNLQGLNGVYNANDVQNKFFNYWLVNAQTGQYKPFVISNDAGLKGTLDPTMIRVSDFLKQGFTFDLKSLDPNGSINLYFNHSGSSRNDWYDSPNVEGLGMRSAKIGLLDDVLGSSASWMNNITDNISSGTNKLIQVGVNSFATLIHSRADMTKWYARTQFNFDRPGNLWKANEQINKAANIETRVKATVFNNKITDSKVTQQDGVDLVSHWQVGQGKYNNSTTDQSNYNRLVVKRPSIKTGTTSVAQILPITTSYNIDNAINTRYQRLFNLNANSQARLTFKFDQQIENASWQIFSSWSKDAKITNHATSSDNVNFTSSFLNTPQWFDVRQQNNPNTNVNNLFGQVNNAISPNTITNTNHFSLRTMLQIDRPTNSPGWLQRADARFFKAYLISGMQYNNETTFQEILNQFINWKAANIDLGENQEQKASGLANLTIKAFLEVNPQVIKPNNNVQPILYKKTNKQILMLDNKGQSIIYDDKYTDQRVVYDQSATSYDQMQNYGYGTNVQANLAKSLQTVPPTTTKLLIKVDLNNLSSTLLRKSANSNDAVFSIEYESQAQDKLVIKPANAADQEWFTNRFSSFNKMLNLFPVFEYQSKTDDPNNGPWKQVEDGNQKLWTDAELKQNLTQNNGKLVLPTNKTDIKRVRVRLVTKTNNGNPTDVNDFIEWQNWNENSEKLVSKVHVINPQKITVNTAWFDQTTLSLTNNDLTLEQISATDIDRYEEEIKNLFKAQNSNSTQLFSHIELKYTFGSQTDLNAAALASAIKSALNDTSRQDKGIFSLWNGTQGLKIRVRFELKNGAEDDYVLVDQNGNPITNENDRSSDLISNIKTKVDLSDYFSQLKSTPLEATEGAQAGQLTSFDMPRGTTGKFSNQSYVQIVNILNGVGLDFQFKQWSNNSWSAWTDKNNINSYNPQDPALMIGLKITTGWNVKIVIDNAQIDDTYSGIKAQLQIPKLVKSDQNVWNALKQANPLGGDTFRLNIDNVTQAENALKQQLIQFNTTQNPGSDFNKLNDQIEIKYRLGDAGDFRNAQELKDHLAQLDNQDQISNKISFRLTLNSPDPSRADFKLDADAQQIQELLPDGNAIVKKFLHGQKYETEFNQISVTGSDKNNLTYTYGPNIQNIINQNSVAGSLKLEWTYNENLAPDSTQVTGQNPENEWVQKALPTSVAGDVKKLYVRIVNSDPNIYVYGPDENIPSAKTKGTIDLSQIATIVQVDKTWLTTTDLSTSELGINDLTEAVFTNWQQRVLANVQINDQELLKQIKFKFTYKNQTYLSVSDLIAKIQQELTSYSEPHLGIVQLWNGQDKALDNKIQATFYTEANSLVKLQALNGSTAEADLRGDVKTTNIITVVNLTNYINVLKTSKTKVNPKGGARPEEITGFTPPAGSDNTGFLDQKSYDQIVARLNQVGIKVKFSKEINNPTWVDKNQINEYNPRNNKLYLLFENDQNNNLKIQIDQQEILAGQNSSQIEIGLPLAVPRQINLNVATDLVDFPQLMNFRGDTKNILYEKSGAQSIVQRILQRNATEAQGDNEYLNAPLNVKFSVGDTAEFHAVTNDELKTFLASYPDDLTNREIRWKFDLDGADPEQWIFNPDTLNRGLEGTLILDGANSPIKIYVNDKGIYQDLQNPDLQDSTSADLKLDWSAQKITIDKTTGVLSATEINNAQNPRGAGLRVEYTYVDSLSGAETDATNNDPFQGWSKIMPTSFDPNISTNLAMRIRLVDESKYTYNKINQKFTIDLSNIPAIINLDGSWLAQTFTTQTVDLNQLSATEFQTYENQVWQAANLGAIDRSRVKIAYTFDNNDYVDVNALIQAINQFKNSHSNEPGLGILQLWNNQNSGQKITTKFVKADDNDPQYKLNISNTNSHDLDLSQVVTTIDFSAVLEWMKKLEVRINEGNNNQINDLLIPRVDVASDPYFHNQEWSAVESALATFGLTVQYSKNIQGQADNWGPITNVNQYDPKNPSFKIRFQADGSKSVNIKLKLSANEILIGQNQNASNGQTIQIKARLLVQINQQFIQEFKTRALFGGNTKELNIDKVINPQDEFVNKIIEENMQNDARYEQLVDQLEIQYLLQKEAPTNQSQWRDLSTLKGFLSGLETDQATNQIWFRINLKDTTNFSINPNDQQPAILSAHQEATAADLKIKYYVNAAQWETQADQIRVSGPTDQLVWNFEQIFNQGVIETPDHKIYLQTAAGQALQVYFILDNANAAYDNPADLSDDINEIETKWVSIKPTQIRSGIKNLKIKLVAAQGFIYGPAAANPKTAQAHNVAINVQNVLYVDKTWFNAPLVNQELEISALNKSHFDTWEDRIYEEIRNRNNLTDGTIAHKVKIKYLFEGQKYDVPELLDEILKLRTNYGDQSTLGIVLLWNQQSQNGFKIEAVFDLDDADKNDYILRTTGNPGQPNPADLQGLVDTDKIYTSISLINYISVLKQEKTTVEPKPGAAPGQIKSFNPPRMSGAVGDGFLTGYDYEQIAQRLAAVGVQIKFAQSASTNAADWVEKNQIDAYNLQTSALFLSFEVLQNAANVKVQWDRSQSLNPGQNLQGNNAVRLPLNVPKYIIINQQAAFWTTIAADFNFNGNTKVLDFDEAKINEFVQKILQENVTNSGDGAYANAPLEIHFQVGDLAFTKIDELKDYLTQQTEDLTDRTIRFKFVIPNAQDQDWKLENPQTEYAVFKQADPLLAKIKIFINDNGNYAQLTQMHLGGTQDQLVWPWPWGSNGIDEASGILNPPKGGFGQGLKLQFSFVENPSGEGNDPETQWVGTVPKTFKSQYNQIWVQIKLTNPDLYTYEKADAKFSLSLDHITKIIKTNASWLEKQLQNGQQITLETLTTTHFDAYEQAVKAAAQADPTNPVDATLINKLTIEYQFNNQSGWVNAAKIIELINAYQANLNQASLGILQLWNTQVGVQIKTRFADANQSDNFEIQPLDPTNAEKVINTANVLTTIDFSDVLTWFKALEVPIDEGQNQQITKLKIPNVVAANSPFNGKTWVNVETVLQSFGLTIEYSVNLKNQAANWGPITNVNQYDPTNPSFRIRFAADGTKSTNVNLKLAANQIVEGATANQSAEEIIKIKARLLVQISPQLVAEFKAEALFGGNTKILDVDGVINAQDEFVNKIIEENMVNDPRYAQLIGKLEIEYVLQQDAPDGNTQWYDLNGLKNFLSQQDADQATNQIWFKINLTDQANFNINATDEQPVVLNQHQDPTDANLRIQYYINNGQWENQISQIIVSGPSDQLNWNFNQIFNGIVIEKPNKVFLQTAAGEALQVYFTLDNPGATYNNPADLSDDINDIKTKWVSVKPNQIRAGTQSIKVKLVPTTGFVYGPAVVSPQLAQAHDVQINVQNVLYVDKTWFNLPFINQTMEVSALSQADFSAWENQIYQQIKNKNQITDEAIARKIKIKYLFEGQSFDSQNLIDEITRLRTDYTNESTLGLVQLWNSQSNRGSKIEAIFTLDAVDQNDFILKVDNQNNPSEADLKGLVGTDQIYTSVSLIDYIEVLKQQKTTVELKPGGNPGELNSFTPPAMPGTIGDKFLSGYTFSQISQRLQELGIQIKFAQTASQNSQDWFEQNQINSYDIQTSVLFLSFEVEADAQNAKVQWSSTQTLNPGENLRGNKAIKLILDVPKYIIIDENQQFWNNIKQDFNFNGNTKFIEFDEQAINNFIKQILDQNFANSGNDPTYQSAPLKIEFQIGDLEFTEISQLKDYLKRQKDDLTKRTINFKFSIPKAQANNWQLQNPDAIYTLLTDQDQEINKIKIYINDKNIFNDLATKTKISGTNEELVWQFFNDIQIDENSGILSATNRGQGLKVEFTLNENADPNDLVGTDINQEWIIKMPKQVDLNKNKIFLRLAVVDPNLYFYEQQNQKIELSLDAVLLVLNLKTDWLKEILLTGNTKNLDIDEAAAQNQLQNVIPQNRPELIKFEYTIDGKIWKQMDQFKTLLNQQAGQKDENNFIIKREDIKVHFALNAAAPDQAKYQMKIDGNIIQPDDLNNPQIQLINELNQPPLNPAVQGYIEINHLKHFIVDNFAIEGSNTKPQLKIKQKEALETLMQNYATDNLFDIWITGKKDNRGQWDFSQKISLLTAGNKFIDDNELLNRGFSLDTNKNVALKFVAKNAKYDVYYNGAKQAQGYLLDISANVRITFEITNPFTAQNKTLALWWTEDQNKTQGKYFQGQGGFKIVNGLADGNVDQQNFVSALSWLNSNDSGLANKEKEVLEFVYHIYEGQPNAEEIARVGSHEQITNYESQIWKPLEPVLEKNGNDFTQSLNLKVGQYVSVALRVKQEYASGEDVYTLKNNEHSFMAPFNDDQSKTPGRAHGYKLNPDQLAIQKDTIALENMLNSDQPPLDGYTNIKRLNLEQDLNENYKGVDLELQLFHEFHQGAGNQNVLITPFDKIKLIKRQTGNSATTNYFKDHNGDPIRDSQGNPIPILVDGSGKPMAPIETTTALKSQFTDYGDGIFGLTVPTNQSDRDQWGIFKNETVKVVFSAKAGVGGLAEPDFILAQPKSEDLKTEISPEIKFPIFNQDNIKYEFNQSDFSKENVEFESSSADQNVPIDGKSKVKTLIKLTKITNNNPDGQVIQGLTAQQAVNNLKNELKNSFQDKLRFETIYEKSDGGTETKADLELYKLTSLKNNDRIKVRIVSADNDFIWAEPPKALTIHVNGLTAKAPNPNKLQFLRVEQSGQINGQGAFKVLINDPRDPNSDPNEILEGWKFVIRVWNSAKEIKQDWTDDQSKIVNLTNGDKIEWKLIDQFNNPVSDPYYNTVAGEHQLNPDGSTKLVFNQMNYAQGINSAQVVTEGVGQYPDDPAAYPENSGFVVSGLKDQFEIFEISETNFTKVINKLEPHYVGVNGQGRINFNAIYLDNNYYVNTDGELYEKPTNRLVNQQLKVEANEVKEISLDEFLSNVTFYTSDPNLVGYQNGFKFVNNETNIDNQLHNGDEIWAQFDLLANNNEINQGVNVALGPVSGLQEVVTDQMSTLWYVMMALGGIITLGGLTALVALLRRHKKLKR